METLQPRDIQRALDQAGFYPTAVEEACEFVCAELNTIDRGVSLGLSSFNGGWPLQAAYRQELIAENYPGEPPAVRFVRRYYIWLLQPYETVLVMPRDLLFDTIWPRITWPPSLGRRRS